MLNRFLRCSQWLIVASMFMMASMAVQALPRGVTEVTSVEGINEYRLDNGLTVLLFPDHSKDTVTVNVTYKVGSKHENYGETGMAHLLEHLLFKGSKKHKDIPEELSKHGAKPNGTTWIDRTNYYETFAATEENIDWALDLEADRMVNSFIAREDLDSEMTVVRNEFERTENNPFRVMMQRMMSAAYSWHNNGKTTIGARSDIENVSIERLQAFYRKYYQPDNAVLTIAGKFDEEQILKKIKKTFGKIRKPKRQLQELYTVEPAQDGEKKVVVRRVGDMQLLAAAYHVPAGSHPDYASVEVLSQVLGDTPRGRLHKQVVEQKLAVATFGFTFQLEEPGLLFLAAQLEKDADMEKSREAFIKTAEGIAKAPITEEEVERAKANLLKEYELAFNSSEQIAILLSEYIGMGDWRLLFLTRDRIENVTAQDVQRVAQSYVVRNNRTEGRFYPTQEPERIEIPVVDSVAAMLDGYEGRKAIAQGEAFDPSFDNIQQRTTLLTLASGTKVALLPKKTRGESVKLEFSMQFGDEKQLWNKSDVAQLAGGMLMRGTEQLDREQLNDRIDQLKASIQVSGDVDSASGSIETTRANLAEVIALLADILANPRFGEKEFDQLITSKVASLEASRQEPQAIVARELYRFYAPYPKGHPLYSPTLDEQISAVKAAKLKELKAFHHAFYAADHMQIAVVGDFDPEQIAKELENNFGNWAKGKKYIRIAQPFQEIPPVDKTIDTPDKENAAMVAMLPLSIGKQHPDAVALEVGAYIYGGGFLNSRLAERLRQNDGLSYHASAWVALSEMDKRGQFSAYAIFAPQNRQAVEQGIKEELQRLLKDGVSEEELKNAKSGMLQKARVARTENNYLAGTWVGNLYADRDMSWHKQLEETLIELTVEQVNQALRKYLTVEQLSFVEAADLSKAVQ